jgi:hypothetical protein
VTKEEAVEQLRLARELAESVIRGAEDPAAKDFAWLLTEEIATVTIEPGTCEGRLVVTILVARQKGN